MPLSKSEVPQHSNCQSIMQELSLLLPEFIPRSVKVRVTHLHDRLEVFSVTQKNNTQ